MAIALTFSRQLWGNAVPGNPLLQHLNAVPRRHFQLTFCALEGHDRFMFIPHVLHAYMCVTESCGFRFAAQCGSENPSTTYEC